MSTLVSSRLPCPVCPSSDAYHIWSDGHGYCFSCQYYHSPRHNGSTELDYTYQYLPWRGIIPETYKTYQVYTKIDSEGRPTSVGFGYPNGDHKVRLIDKKEFYWTKSGSAEPTGLFGRDKFAAGSHKYVTITEGELDALSLYQVLRSPVVSVQSSSTAVRDCTVDWDYLNSFERIYLAFDNDRPGREAVSSVARLFDYNKVFVVKFSNRKDANEYLQAGEALIMRTLHLIEHR